VAGFQHKGDALRFLAELRENLSKYDLELHPEKTRVLEFGRFAAESRKRRGLGKPETFDFLGFTHICGKSRTGKYQLQRRTMRKRIARKLGEVKVELRKRMHQKIPVVGRWLASVVRGHFQYYGVPLNYRGIRTFHHEVVRLWRRTLMRRSHKAYITLERMDKLSSLWLPKPKIHHPYPSERLVV